MTQKTVSVVITGNPDSAVRAMSVTSEAGVATSKKLETEFERSTSKIGGLFSGLSNQLGAFGIPFTGVLDKVGQKFDAASSKGSGLLGILSSVAAVGAAGAIVALGAIAVESIHLADDFEKSHAQLQNSLKNTGVAYASVAPQIAAADKAGEKLGYNMTATEGALARAQIATGDMGKSTKLLTIAEDVSAKTHKDLAASMLLVIKASEGNIGALKRQGIDLNVAAGGAKALANAQSGLQKAGENLALVEEHIHQGRLKGPAAADALAKAHGGVTAAQEKLNSVQKSGNEILKALEARFGGSAAANAKTFGGSMAALGATVQDVGIKIGLKLIPYVQELQKGLMDGVTWLMAHRADFKRFFDDVVVAVQGAWVVVEPIYKALWEQPQGAFQLIDDLIHGKWDKIFGDLVDIVKNAFGLLAAPFVGVYHLFQDSIDKIATKVSDGFNDVVSFFTGLPDRAIAALGDLGTKFAQIGRDITNGIISGLGDLGSAVFTALTGGIEFSIKKVKGKYEITSPSKVFARQIGAPLMQGLIGGIDDNLGSLQSKMGSVSSILSMGRVNAAGMAAYPLGSNAAAGSSMRSGPSQAAVGGHTIIVQAQTNADAHDIASEVGWALRVA